MNTGGTSAVGEVADASVAVVICAYTEDRWDDLLASYRSLTVQSQPPDEIFVVIDHNDALLNRFRRHFPLVRVLANSAAKGLSGARNTGIAATSCSIVLFLDDDASAGPDWVRDLTAPLSDQAVQGVAGWAVPRWDAPGRPTWFPESFLWVVGCSYEGLPLVPRDIRNPIGCAMGFRRAALDSVGGFTDGIGRIGTHPVGCEETQLSIRLRQLDPTARIVLVPDATVSHRVSRSRLSRTYFLRRCFWEGVSKAVVSGDVGSRAALEAERSYTTKVLPRAFGRGLLDTVRGDFSGVQRSAAVASGLAVTAVGYLRGLVSHAGRKSVGRSPEVAETVRPSGPAADAAITDARRGAA